MCRIGFSFLYVTDIGNPKSFPCNIIGFRFEITQVFHRIAILTVEYIHTTVSGILAFNDRLNLEQQQQQ